MPYDLTNPLVIGISSRALFDLEAENRIFEEQGLAAYEEYQDQVKAHEDQEQELYERYQDAVSRQEKAYTRLSALLKLGYVPTDAELAAAGLTRAMAQLIAAS